jgi:hypothetical protein
MRTLFREWGATLACGATIISLLWAAWAFPADAPAITVNGFQVSGQPAGSGLTLTVTPQPPNPPTPAPPPPVPPAPRPKTLSAVGIWTALGAPIKLASAAHSQEIATFLESQSGTWLVLDPAMESQPGPQPRWLGPWFAAAKASGKQPPLVIWHDSGKVIRTDQLTPDSDAAAVLTLAKSCLGTAKGSVTVRGRTYRTGLVKRTKAPGKAGFAKVSAVLSPLTSDQYPACDLGYLVPRVSDQGQTGTCHAHAAVLMVECVRRVQFGKVNDTPLSPWCLATLTNGWNGATLSDDMQILAKSGVCTLATWGYTNQAPTGWQNDAKQHILLAVYDSPDSDPLGYLAASLARGWTCEIGISVGDGFEPDADGYITYDRGSGWGGHAVLACGLKKTADGRRWIKILNSWGTSWGQGGFAWIESRFLTESGFNDLWVATTVSAASADRAVTPVIARPARKSSNQASLALAP